MTQQTYQQTPGLSSSMIKQFYLTSPAHFKYWLDNGGESEALRQGRLIHAYLLQPEKLNELVHVADDISLNKYYTPKKINIDLVDLKLHYLKTTKPFPYKTYNNGKNKKWKENEIALANKYNKDFALRSELDWVEAMQNKLKERGYFDIIKPMDKEIPFYKEIDGIKYKCLVDCYSPELVVDYKSSVTAKPERFDYEAIKHGYHIQAAMYLDISGANEFKIIAQEKTEPYECFLFKMPEDLIEYGRFLYKKYGARLKQCFEDDFWPGYEADYIGNEHVIRTPQWIVNQLNPES